MFGGRADAMNIRIGRETFLAAVELTDSRSGAAVAMVPYDSVFAEWRRTVSMNVTLFVVTAGVLLVILYAYFSQAARAQAAGLPAELPVMAALVESNLTNVHYGDADSLGYFQMRTSIWDKGEYAGFSSNPELQLKWFIDNAVAVKEKRIARGYTDFEHDPSKWGEWIADVERPAEQYRGRYQLRLEEAQGLLGAPPAA